MSNPIQIDLNGEPNLTEEQGSAILVFLVHMDDHISAMERTARKGNDVGAVEWASGMISYTKHARQFIKYAAQQAKLAMARTGAVDDAYQQYPIATVKDGKGT